MTFHIETTRLILRPFQDADLETFLAYRNDPEVARYQSWDVPFARERGREFVQSMKTALPNQPGEWYQVALELKSTGEMIGDVAFCIKADDTRQAIIGYSLARPHWGCDYAYEALSQLMRYFFVDLGLHRVTAECDVENPASWRLLEKLGFRREAYFVENILFKGKYGSEYSYALLGREWAERQRSQ